MDYYNIIKFLVDELFYQILRYRYLIIGITTKQYTF